MYGNIVAVNNLQGPENGLATSANYIAVKIWPNNILSGRRFLLGKDRR